MQEDALKRELSRALREMGVADPGDITFERPRNPEHGDLATNIAMAQARHLGRSPRQIAEDLVQRLDVSATGIRTAEVAGPGFINFRFRGDLVYDGLAAILERGEQFGRSDATDRGQIVVEFVSANPTGALHIGHGRQAALGDTVSELLTWTGWKVHREFYYNDAGEQINRLARSVWTRYQQVIGRELAFPEDGYHGEYVSELAAGIVAEDGDRWLGDDSSDALDRMRIFAVARLRAEQNRDLDEFGVHFDNFFLESSLFDEGRIEKAIAALRETGLVYEHEGALWLKTTEFGDDKDRVMVKSTGQPTYFLPDVAYHMTKWERGFHSAINIQGADHHGTVARVRAGLHALGLPEGYPEYLLHQMVLVLRGGQEMKFSKRAGSYVTLRDLFEEVGVDVTRYFFLMRRPEAQLTFDLDLAMDHSEKNPVFKVQYAHARMCSIFRKAEVEPAQIDQSAADLSLLTHTSEIELIKLLLRFPEIVESAASRRTPHSICEYLEEVAGSVNSWYHAGNLDRDLRVVGVPEPLSSARLVLTRAVQRVLFNGLQLLGITAPDRLEREAEPAV